MPITKSAKKADRQTIARTERNKGIRTAVKTYMKKVLTLSKTNPEEARKALPKAYSAIDTATKKGILHKKTASRRKSRLARSLASGDSAK